MKKCENKSRNTYANQRNEMKIRKQNNIKLQDGERENLAAGM